MNKKERLKFFRELASKGGKETVKRKGREYMSEIGKRGRAKQLKDSRK